MSKTYWVTGASSGIGEALAKRLNSLGHNVILSARSEEKLKVLAASLPHPDKARVVRMDLSRSDQLGDVVMKAVEAFGKIDSVILNAGISQRSLFQDTNLDVYRNLMEVNFFGNIALTKALLPHFVQKNAGQFVIMTSLVGKFGTSYRSGYAASKHALHGFFDSLRAEMMMDGKDIGVTIICPGFVNTEISFNALGGDGKATHVYDETNAGGLSPEEFAKRAVSVIEEGKFEAYIGGKEVMGVYLKRFLPDFFAKKIAKAKVR